MVVSGSRTMIAGSLSSCIDGFRRSWRSSRSSVLRPSCSGIVPAFVATGVGGRVGGQGGRRSRRTSAYSWDGAPRYLIRDRDRIYGAIVTRRMRAMGIRDKPTAPASPWQNGFAERLIGSIRRECVDHFIVLGEQHLRRILRAYARYYNKMRTHRSLDKDAPVSRPVQHTGIISSCPILGGLHHQYVRV